MLTADDGHRTMKRMTEKHPPLYVEADSFKCILAARYAAFKARNGGKDNMAGFARSLGLTRAAVYNLMNGSSVPGDDLLKRLGGRWVICIDSSPELKDPAARKPKAGRRKV